MKQERDRYASIERDLMDGNERNREMETRNEKLEANL